MLINNINLCRTVLKNDLTQISKWFIVRRHGEYHDYDMNELVSTCIEISKKTNNNHSRINSSEKIDTNIYLKGETFNYLVDIITMLYFNAIEHSGFNNLEDMYIQIEISEIPSSDVKDELMNIDGQKLDFLKFFEDHPSSTLKIKVLNLLAEHKDEEKIRITISDIFEKIENPDKYKNFISEEGGTGIPKIYYTLKHNIGSTFAHQYYIDENKWFIAEIFINLQDLIAYKEGENETIIYRG